VAVALVTIPRCPDARLHSSCRSRSPGPRLVRQLGPPLQSHRPKSYGQSASKTRVTAMALTSGERKRKRSIPAPSFYPAIPPTLSVAEAKAFLRVEHCDDDAVLCASDREPPAVTSLHLPRPRAAGAALALCAGCVAGRAARSIRAWGPRAV